MNVGAFMGGGPAPQTFAAMVALAVFFTIAAFFARGAASVGGRAALIASIIFGIVGAGIWAAIAWQLGFPRWSFPVFALVSGAAGALGASWLATPPSSEQS